MGQIAEIGVEEEVADKLMEAGIFTGEDLIRLARRPKARELVARRTGIPIAALSQYLNQADMARVKGVGNRFARLLVASVVRSLASLAESHPESLHRSLQRTNQKNRLVRRMPSPAEVGRWIEAAGQLKSALTD